MNNLRPQPLWRGVAVALVTLFEPDSVRVDAAATAAHAGRLVDLGVGGVLVAGTTGEADALTDDERNELLAAVREACPGVPVIAGASGPWTRPAVARTQAAMKAGADAVLVAPPPRSLGLPAYYAAVADAASPARVLAELDAWDGWTYVGSAALTGYARSLGATGAILAVANAVPEEAIAAWDGDGAAQRRLFGPHRAA